MAIIDIDCAVKNGFDAEDQSNLEELAALLSRSCDWQIESKSLVNDVLELQIS